MFGHIGSQAAAFNLLLICYEINTLTEGFPTTDVERVDPILEKALSEKPKGQLIDIISLSQAEILLLCELASDWVKHVQYVYPRIVTHLEARGVVLTRQLPIPITHDPEVLLGFYAGLLEPKIDNEPACRVALEAMLARDGGEFLRNTRVMGLIKPHRLSMIRQRTGHSVHRLMTVWSFSSFYAANFGPGVLDTNAYAAFIASQP